jgi:Concanavalin A-like lectin/glucanases superfamily
MSLIGGAGGLGEILRRHFPRSERIIKSIIQTVSFQSIARVSINDFDLRNIPVLLKSKIRVVEDILSRKISVSAGFPEYLPSLEPDYQYVICYLHTDHVSDNYIDYSGFGNHPRLYYSSGTLNTDNTGPDLGNGYPSRCFDVSGNSTNRFVFVIPPSASMALAALTAGFSIHIRFRPDNLTADAGQNRTLYGSADDINNAVRIVVDPNGALVVHVKKAGATTKVKSSNGVITLTNWYDAVITCNAAATVITIYLASGTYTGADVSTLTFNTTDFSEFIMGYGRTGTDKGYWAGCVQHFVMWQRVLTAGEAANLLANKWTTNNTTGKKVALLFYTLAKSP